MQLRCSIWRLAMNMRAAAGLQSVSIDVAGKTHIAKYTVSEGIVQVTYGNQSNSFELGSVLTEDSVARMLLREMINK